MLELPAYLFVVLGKDFPRGQWLIQLTCACWPDADGKLTHALRRDLKKIHPV